jgi:hypothetical protein
MICLLLLALGACPQSPEFVTTDVDTSTGDASTGDIEVTTSTTGAEVTATTEASSASSPVRHHGPRLLSRNVVIAWLKTI